MCRDTRSVVDPVLNGFPNGNRGHPRLDTFCCTIRAFNAQNLSAQYVIEFDVVPQRTGYCLIHGGHWPSENVYEMGQES